MGFALLFSLGQFRQLFNDTRISIAKGSRCTAWVVSCLLVSRFLAEPSKLISIKGIETATRFFYEHNTHRTQNTGGIWSDGTFNLLVCQETEFWPHQHLQHLQPQKHWHRPPFWDIGNTALRFLLDLQAPSVIYFHDFIEKFPRKYRNIFTKNALRLGG